MNLFAARLRMAWSKVFNLTSLLIDAGSPTLLRILSYFRGLARACRPKAGIRHEMHWRFGRDAHGAEVFLTSAHCPRLARHSPPEVRFSVALQPRKRDGAISSFPGASDLVYQHSLRRSTLFCKVGGQAPWVLRFHQ